MRISITGKISKSPITSTNWSPKGGNSSVIFRRMQRCSNPRRERPPYVEVTIPYDGGVIRGERSPATCTLHRHVLASSKNKFSVIAPNWKVPEDRRVRDWLIRVWGR